MNTEAFGAVQPLWNAFPSVEGGLRNDAEKSGSGMFADIFKTAVENVKSTDAQKNEAEYLLATGQLDNPAALTIASTKAQMSVDLLVQLRNKALDAYSELTRISL